VEFNEMPRGIHRCFLPPKTVVPTHEIKRHDASSKTSMQDNVHDIQLTDWYEHQP